MLQPNFFSFDCETNGREFRDPAFKIWAVCISDGRKTIGFDRFHWHEAVKMLEAAPALIGHNASLYDRAAIKAYTGTKLKTGDTFFLAYLLDEEGGRFKRLNLQALAVKYLGVEPWKDEVTWQWSETDEWEDTDPRWDAMMRYCARDTEYTHRLAAVLEERVKAESRHLWAVYENIMLPASRALSQLEENGVYIDQDACRVELAALGARAELGARQELNEAAKKAGIESFNPGSPKQVGELLYERLGIPCSSFTPQGKPATDELTLKRLAASEPKAKAIVEPLLELRGINKLVGTYLEPYLKRASAEADSRIHPSYSIAYVATGRTSAFDPNIQNVPRDARVRRIVAAPPGKVMLQADLATAELRILAYVAREEVMLDAFRRGDDLHMVTAERVLKIPRTEISKEERTNSGKIPNFLLSFGGTTETFMDQAFKDYDIAFKYAEADAIREGFHQGYPALFPYYERVYDRLYRDEFVESHTGRRRRFSGFRQMSQNRQSACLREALNFLVQSLTADIALMALVNVTGRGYKTTAFIHDAIQVELDDDPAVIANAAADIKYAIEVEVPHIINARFGFALDVPIIADISVGWNWAELKDLTTIP